MEQNNRQQGAKKPTATEAAAIGFDPTQSYTFYDFTKKGGRK